jgi:NTP pyrophosphatase (non-canonical NTP hydrolase)
VPNLLNKADAALVNIDLNDVTAQLAALVLRWTHGSRPTAIKEMIEAVTEFHRKHGFDIGTRDPKVMQYRMGLLVEELGEINECFSKGRGDITEEHADLLILLLGNCITMGIDLEVAFWKKYAKIMKRPAKRVGDTIRVSHWRKGSAASSNHGYFHVSVEQLLRGDDEDDAGDPLEPVQLSLFEQ